MSGRPESSGLFRIRGNGFASTYFGASLGMPAPIYTPGNIHRIPPGSTDLEDLDAHFHLLVAVHPQRGSATMLFGSSSSTDSECGAPSVLVQPSSRNSLTKPTFFYSPALVVCAQARLGSSGGDIQTRLPEIRASIKKAVGYRTGAQYQAPRGTASLRGTIVEVTEKYAARYQTRFFAILTNHHYSARRRYQVLAPLYDVQPQGAGGPVASVPIPPALKKLFATGANSIYSPAELVRSLWDEKAIVELTDRSLDNPFLEEIEDAICSYLSL